MNGTENRECHSAHGRIDYGCCRVRLVASYCGFAPAALAERAPCRVRLVASYCGFAPAALTERAPCRVRLVASYCGFAPAAQRRTAPSNETRSCHQTKVNHSGFSILSRFALNSVPGAHSGY